MIAGIDDVLQADAVSQIVDLAAADDGDDAATAGLPRFFSSSSRIVQSSLGIDGFAAMGTNVPSKSRKSELNRSVFARLCTSETTSRTARDRGVIGSTGIRCGWILT